MLVCRAETVTLFAHHSQGISFHTALLCLTLVKHRTYWYQDGDDMATSMLVERLASLQDAVSWIMERVTLDVWIPLKTSSLPFEVLAMSDLISFICFISDSTCSGLGFTGMETCFAFSVFLTRNDLGMMIWSFDKFVNCCFSVSLKLVLDKSSVELLFYKKIVPFSFQWWITSPSNKSFIAV